MKNVKPISWLFEKSRNQHWKMWILIVVNALLSALSVAFAIAIKMVIDGAVVRQKSQIIWGAVFVCSIIVFQFIFRLITKGLAEHISGKLEIAYKSHIFSQILNKKYDKITEYHSGELLNRLSSDASIVSDGVTTILPNVVAAVVRLLCAVIALAFLDWTFALVFVVCGLLVFIVMGMLKGRIKWLHKKAQETDGQVRSFMQESIENILALKVFSVNDKIEDRADQLQQKNFAIKMKRRNYSATGHATYGFIFSAGYVFALIYGAFKLYGDTMGVFTYGSLSAILQLVNNVQVPFASLSTVFSKYYSTIASAERLIEIENIANENLNTQFDAEKSYEQMKSISLENVNFSYDKNLVLKNASITINKGDKVAIVGASGIGKSTLLKLLLGVYKADNGTVNLNLNDKIIPLDETTRRLFSFVPQGNILFSGTLKENITFINDKATEEEIENALSISCINDFLGELPNGLETFVGENGFGLSEGQMQRVAIARALLSTAPILLLDEATSALDENTENKLLENLNHLKDVTVLLITHRKSVLKICNKIVKIKDKKFIVEN